MRIQFRFVREEMMNDRTDRVRFQAVRVHRLPAECGGQDFESVT